MQKFALTLFKAFSFAVLYQTARPCTARIPAKPDDAPDRSVYTLHKIPKVTPTSARNLRKMPQHQPGRGWHFPGILIKTGGKNLK